MFDILIGIAWLVIIAIVCAGAVWVLLYLIKLFWTTMPAKVEQAAWAIYGLLLLIYLLGIFAGGGGLPHPGFFGHH